VAEAEEKISEMIVVEGATTEGSRRGISKSMIIAIPTDSIVI
jgi:hypothetical protein